MPRSRRDPSGTARRAEDMPVADARPGAPGDLPHDPDIGHAVPLAHGEGFVLMADEVLRAPEPHGGLGDIVGTDDDGGGDETTDASRG